MYSGHFTGVQTALSLLRIPDKDLCAWSDLLGVLTRKAGGHLAQCKVALSDRSPKDSLALRFGTQGLQGRVSIVVVFVLQKSVLLAI